jgi:hypothetical protein
VGLKLNGTHQLLVYVDDVNLLEDNTDTIKKNTETLTLVRRLVLKGMQKNLRICCCLVTRIQTSFAPTLGTLTAAPETQAPAPGITALAPGPTARTADPHPEMTLHPALVGIIAASGPERKGVLLPAPIASKKN